MSTICVGPSSTGSASGADWNNQISWSSLSFARGNTYYLADGSYSGKTINTAVSGSTYIYIVKASIGAHGTSTGWSDTMGDGQALFTGSGAILLINTKYISIDGVAGSGKTGSSYGISIITSTRVEGDSPITCWNGSVTGMVLKYLELGCPAPDGATFNRCLDERTDIYGPAVVSTDITVQHCYMHGGLVGITFDGDGSTTENNVVEYCYLKSIGGQEHCEMIQLASTKGVTLRYNIFEDLLYPSTTYIEPQFSPSNLYVYGNVFRAVDSGEGTNNPSILSMTAGEIITNCFIYNNTIYGLHPPPGTYQDTGVGASSGGNDSVNVIVRNNIWQSCSYDPGFAGVTTQDHNILNDGSASFVDAAGGDFHLVSNTSAGVNLGSPYDTDPDGVTRATWSRGAYEFTTGGGGSGGTGGHKRGHKRGILRRM